MVKRKRKDDDEYVDFCSGLQKAGTTNDTGNTSYVYSQSRAFKRPKINPNFYKPTTVHYRYVSPEENVYKKIQKLIKNDTIVIEEILEVKNSTLEDAFEKKKEEKLAEYGDKVKEIFGFHGTKERNVDSICKFNFDWRLNGSNKGHKFGKGVCFSKSANYASNYSEKHSHSKVMIVAKVLIANVCRGYHDMSIPPPGYDTSQKGDNGAVLVKYEDNEFFPAYVLQYHFAEYKEVNNQKIRFKRKKRNFNKEYYSDDNCYFNIHFNYNDYYEVNLHYRNYDRYGYSINNYYNCNFYSHNYRSKNYQVNNHYNRRYNDHDYSIDGYYNNDKGYYAFN